MASNFNIELGSNRQNSVRESERITEDENNNQNSFKQSNRIIEGESNQEISVNQISFGITAILTNKKFDTYSDQ